MNNFNKAGNLFFFHYHLRTGQFTQFIKPYYITPKGNFGVNFDGFRSNGIKPARLGQFQFNRDSFTCQMVTDKENYYKNKARFFSKLIPVTMIASKKILSTLPISNPFRFG